MKMASKSCAALRSASALAPAASVAFPPSPEFGTGPDPIRTGIPPNWT